MKTKILIVILTACGLVPLAGHAQEAVDMGLSVKWASCNVGASLPSDNGDYYAWGEAAVKSNYSWETYKWCQGNEMTMTKYRTMSDYSDYDFNEFTDGKTVLDPEDDAAHANMGDGWRIPSYEEWEELIQECAWTWTSQNGKNGYKVTSKKNGNSIFLPAGGFRSDTDLNDSGSCGHYWYSSIDEAIPFMASCVIFDLNGVEGWSCDFRCYGYSIRPVYAE